MSSLECEQNKNEILQIKYALSKKCWLFHLPNNKIPYPVNNVLMKQLVNDKHKKHKKEYLFVIYFPISHVLENVESHDHILLTKVCVRDVDEYKTY